MGQDSLRLYELRCEPGMEMPGARDAALAGVDCVDEYLTRLFLPWRHAGDVLLIACADLSPENRCWLAARHGAVALFEISRADLLAQLEAQFAPGLSDDAIYGLSRRLPELSAHRVITARQGIVFAGLGAALLAALWLHPFAVMRIIVGGMSLAFFAGALFRGGLAWLGRKQKPRAPAIRSHDAMLPLYTILAPLYREANVLPALAAALLSLDYPQDRLDIKLVVEADDTETLCAAHLAAAGHAAFQVIAVPPGNPRTKPKAVNYALRQARGDFLVIYDAEDRPERDQLRKAVAEFRNQPRELACLQAQLNFYNIGNWLTNGVMALTPQACS